MCSSAHSRSPRFHLVPLSHQLDVLLRHRPRSISWRRGGCESRNARLENRRVGLSSFARPFAFAHPLPVSVGQIAALPGGQAAARQAGLVNLLQLRWTPSPIRIPIRAAAPRAPGRLESRSSPRPVPKTSGAMNRSPLAGQEVSSRSGRLDSNQRPFGRQPNALLAPRGASQLLLRIPVRFRRTPQRQVDLAPRPGEDPCPRHSLDGQELEFTVLPQLRPAPRLRSAPCR
jgi:hypothetical protein